jgi:hypothetical protein
MKKLSSLRIGQKVKFYSDRQLLEGKIVSLSIFPKERDCDSKSYYIEAEVINTDYEIAGTYQLRPEELK